MNPHSLELLEYESLRSLVGRYIGSALGRSILNDMMPVARAESLEPALRLTAEAMAYSNESDRTSAQRDGLARLRFTDLPDCEAGIGRLRIEGTVLDSLELFSVLALLERATEIRGAIGPHGNRFPGLAGLASRIGDFRSLLRELSGKILPDGRLTDDASVALARIRRDIEKHRRHIAESLERFVRSHREDGVLQEDFVTIRNERFVIPVVPGAKKRVPGVVHGASGSGQTLFLEPLETIELNNDLVRLTEEEAREVHRILREMTSRLREQATETRAAAQTLGELDFIFAKAQFARDFDAVVPQFSPADRPVLALDEARHPLLQDILKRQKKPIVPVSLRLDSDARTLLISGPNTGGKTVAMKTVGLLALMAQSGVPVTAKTGEFPIFDEVLADIGDEQSLEQSLSSFSAHVGRLKEMLESVTPESLVLLDELGRATDPEEGGALGVAIVEEFRQYGAFTLASTHLLPLKVYGASTTGVLNASMGFDEATLAPTYQLRTGAPGKSAGLDIASRIGLPAHLIDRARSAMSTRDRDLARLLNQLEQRLTEAEAQRHEIGRQERALAERAATLERDAERSKAQQLKDLDRQVADLLTRFEGRAKEAIESMLAATERRKDAERAQRDVSRIKRELHEGAENLRKPQSAPTAPLTIQEGSRVRLKDVREIARVRRLNPDGSVEVEIGMLKMQAPARDVLEVLPPIDSVSKLPSGVTFSSGPRWDTLSREINVIGKPADEATDLVDKFLDTAMLAEIARLRIVHGHGHGVLRKAISQLLAKHPAVEKFYPGAPSEGGTGATIVELKGG